MTARQWRITFLFEMSEQRQKRGGVKRLDPKPGTPGAVVRAARMAKGLSPSELGASAGFSERQIYRIELGEAPWTLRIRRAIEAVLGPLELPGDGQETRQDGSDTAVNG